MNGWVEWLANQLLGTSGGLSFFIYFPVIPSEFLFGRLSFFRNISDNKEIQFKKIVIFYELID